MSRSLSCRRHTTEPARAATCLLGGMSTVGSKAAGRQDGFSTSGREAPGRQRRSKARDSRKLEARRMIHESRIIACLNTDSAEGAYEAAEEVLRSGISVLEVTSSTPGALEMVAGLSKEFPEACLGLGTVLTEDQGRMALQAGASFLMSPMLDPELIVMMSAEDVLFIPGAMTPSEILAGRKLGLPLVKLFPAEAAGGVDAVAALRRIAPNLGLVPSHAISLEMFPKYLRAGAAAVVLSGAIFNKEMLRNSDFHGMADLSLRAQQIVADVS